MSTTNNKNLGHATAYGYAKSKGYTGTEEEFAELMASYADVGQTAVDAALAAQTAKGKAEDAQEAAESAKTAAASSKTAAQTAQAAAEQAAREALAGAGTPLVAASAAAMTDQTKIYVYLGSETGYTSGNWYYWDGSAWTSGGVYNAQALETDTTLTLPGRAADAEETGTRIGDIDNAFGVVHTTWEQGRIGSSGQNVAANYSIRTDYIPCTYGDQFINYDIINNRYRGTFFWYNSVKTYLSSNSAGIAPEGAAFMRMTVNLGSGNTITPSDGVNYPILHMPNVLSIEVGGRAFYTNFGTARIFNVYGKVSTGDRLFFMPLEWTGPTASGFTLYGYDADTGTNTVLEQVESVYEYKLHTLAAEYSYLKVGVTASEPQSDVSFKALVFKVGTDKISPAIYGLGKGIENLGEQIEGLSDEISGLDIPAADTENLYDQSTDTTGYTIDQTGTITSNAYYEYSALISVTPGKTYHLTSTAISDASSTIRVHAYDESEGFIRQLTYKTVQSGVGGSMLLEFTAVSPYVRVVLRTTNTETYLCEGGLDQPLAVRNEDGDLSYAPLSGFALKGKKLSILGASISTFDGYIPSGNSVYYPHTTSSDYPVQTVHDMYWQKVIDATGMELLVDNASAGSYCTTGHGSDSMAGCGDRCEALDDGTTYPDVVIIQLGGNDFTRSTPLGEYDGTQPFPDPSDDASVTDTFREAYAVMLNKITTKYTGAKVFCGTIPIIKGGTYVTDTFPAKNKDQGAGKPGGIMLETYNDAIRELAKLFGCEVVEFSKCGLTFNNVGTYMQDASGSYGQHPDRRGHSMMANAVLHALGQEFGGIMPSK